MTRERDAHGRDVRAHFDHSAGAGLRQLAERVVAASAFTTCVNIFEAALAVVREKDLTPAAPSPHGSSLALGGSSIRTYRDRFHNIYYANRSPEDADLEWPAFSELLALPG